MFLLISGGHTLVIGGQFLSTNMSSPYKALIIKVREMFRQVT